MPVFCIINDYKYKAPDAQEVVAMLWIMAGPQGRIKDLVLE
jgi:hypothetical protein